MTTMTERTVGEIVREKIGRARVFEKVGVDYCCGGGLSLEKACQKAEIDLGQVVQLLDEYDKKENSDQDLEFDHISMTELIDHICQTHHVYLREEFPRLEKLLSRVVEVHGATHRKLQDLNHLFFALRDELISHMMKEEQVLFPIIKQIEKSKKEGSEIPSFHCGSVNNPIQAMEHEHETAGLALKTMRQLTNDYTPPAEACTKFKALYAGLAELEADLHIHIHKENNILFPRAAE